MNKSGQSLAGQTALVTGGAVRIGRALVEMLAEQGCSVVIHCRRARAEAEALAESLRRAGAKAWVLSAELTEPGACPRLIEEAIAAAGPLDILLNSAAVFHKESLDAFTPGSLEAEFRANLFAPMELMQAFARQNRPGQIVNLLDRRIAGLDTACAPYVLSKKALAEATRLAALTWAPRLLVNAVAPGPVLPPPGKGEDYLQDHAGVIPLKKRCSLQDIAQAVLYLLTAPAITGQILYVDGGQHLLSHP